MKLEQVESTIATLAASYAASHDMPANNVEWAKAAEAIVV